MDFFNNASDANRTLNFENIIPLKLLRDPAYITPTPETSWDWINQGSARATDNNLTISFWQPAQANRVRGKSRPLSNPSLFDVRMVLKAFPTYDGANGGVFGLSLFSSTNEVVLFSTPFVWGGALIQFYSSPTAAPVNISAINGGWGYGINELWYRIAADNVNLIFYLSLDGLEWIQIYSEPIGTSIIPTKWGFAGNAQSATAQMSGVVYSAQQTV